MKRLVIIGGGIAGLSGGMGGVALGPRDLEITLIERDQRLGGKIRTDAVDGFVLEAGPDSFLTSKPEVLRLCEELGIADRLFRATPRGGQLSFIMHDTRCPLCPKAFPGMVPMDHGRARRAARCFRRRESGARMQGADDHRQRAGRGR